MGTGEAQQKIAFAQKVIPQILQLPSDTWINFQKVGELVHKESQTFRHAKRVSDFLGISKPGFWKAAM